jgi:hypothetical protein
MEGKKIRVIEGEQVSVGELRPSQRPKDGLFGMRIDIMGALDSAGRFTIRYLTLPENTIKAIRKTGDPDVPYVLTIAQRSTQL